MKASVIFSASMILAITTAAQSQNPVIEIFPESSADNTENVLYASNLNTNHSGDEYNSKSGSKAGNFFYFNFDILLEEKEDKLEVEDWMTNENKFSTFFYFEEETESALELKEWMTDEPVFGISANYIVDETEESLQLENWMTDELIFNMNSSLFETETEEELELENWMIDKNHFTQILIEQQTDELLELEDWMINNKIWE